jgi:hypothetical protein
MKYTATYLLGILTTLILLWVFRFKVLAILIWLIFRG